MILDDTSDQNYVRIVFVVIGNMQISVMLHQDTQGV